ncbi:MAG: hypothetical protein KDC49_20485 [Saprospiraceae bacterium]|nr:hypothetical protein [Saprospiraceae bacterium]
MKAIKSLLYAAISYGAVYCTIWFHELGHAMVYWFYGCKSNLFDLHVPFHFGGSNPYPIIEACADQMSKAATIWSSLNGMVFNVLMIFAGTYLLKKTLGPLLSWFIIVLVCTNYLEIISYLTLCNVIPMGDIAYIHAYLPALQVVLFLLGILALIYFLKFIRVSPQGFKKAASIFSLATFSVMILLRLVFLIF